MSLDHLSSFSGADIDTITTPFDDPAVAGDIMAATLWIEDGTVSSFTVDGGAADEMFLFNSNKAAFMFHTFTGGETEVTAVGSGGSFPFVHGVILSPDVPIEDPIHETAETLEGTTVLAPAGFRVFPFLAVGFGGAPTLGAFYSSGSAAASSPSMRLGVTWRDDGLSTLGEDFMSFAGGTGVYFAGGFGGVVTEENTDYFFPYERRKVSTQEIPHRVDKTILRSLFDGD